MGTIFKRELKSYFKTPLGYIFLALSTFLSAIFFIPQLVPDTVINYDDVLMDMTLVAIFVVPILTMRLISEDIKNGTDRLLYTTPIKLTDIIIGKYLSALVLFVLATAITFIFPIILVTNGVALDIGELITAYLGYILLGGALISIGLFISSLTSSQAVSAIVTTCILLTLWILDVAVTFIELTEKSKQIFEWFLLRSRYEDFSLGILNISSVFYFISVIVLFIFLTYRVIEKRRWSRG